MIVGLSSQPNNPTSNLQIQIASQLALLAAMYSTSTELNATDFCFLLNQETTVGITILNNTH